MLEDLKSRLIYLEVMFLVICGHNYQINSLIESMLNEGYIKDVYLKLYTEKYLLRLVVIFVLSAVFWLLVSGGITQAIIFPFVIWYLESVTVKLLHKVELSVIDDYFGNCFESKDAYGYRVLCYIFYFSLWILFITMLVASWRETR